MLGGRPIPQDIDTMETNGIRRRLSAACNVTPGDTIHMSLLGWLRLGWLNIASISLTIKLC